MRFPRARAAATPAASESAFDSPLHTAIGAIGSGRLPLKEGLALLKVLRWEASRVSACTGFGGREPSYREPSYRAHQASHGAKASEPKHVHGCRDAF